MRTHQYDADARGEKILIIDDDPLVRGSIAAFLEDQGYAVAQAENGREGIAAVEKNPFDLVLVDLRMPVVDGLTVLKRVGEQFPSLPVIVVSGAGMVQDAVEALRLGAWDYIVKPIQDMNFLAYAVSKALERARLIQENIAYQKNLEEQIKERTRELERTNRRLVREIQERKQNQAVTSTLYAVSQAVNSAGELEELFCSIHEILADHFGVSGLCVRLAADHPLFFARPAEADAPSAAREALLNRIMSENIPLSAGPENKSGPWLGVPLRIKGECVGGMAVAAPGASPGFSRTEIDLLASVAELASMGLERRRSEEKIQNSLREKEILLKEIHHRVKNNLQIISSLLSLQSAAVTDQVHLLLFKESRNRILSMALVHDELYRSPDLGRINFNHYAQRLTEKLFAAYCGRKNITRRLQGGDVMIPINTAIPCGLILNELVTNALVHGFSGLDQGCVTICIDRDGQTICMTVADNGVGLPRDLDPEQSDSLGLKLVSGLADQIKGDLSLESVHGATFKIRFNLPEMNASCPPGGRPL